MNGEAPSTQNRHLFRANLSYLQEESLFVIASMAGAFGYIWLWTDIWPVTGNAAPLSAWLGGILFSLAAFVGYVFRRHSLRYASYVTIWCLVGAVGCALLTFRSIAFAYLLILPVIFANVLLTQRHVFLVSAVSVLFLIVVPRIDGNDLVLLDFRLPILTMGMVTVAAWLSARNLYATLAWFDEAYKRAYRNEQMAREHEGELRRLLKALDEITYRLERTNYTLTVERNQAEEARRLKQQFAQTISHELRTPLNLIVSFTELMAQSPEYYGAPLPPAYMRDLNIAHRNARHLQKLVNDVLDLARLESAQMTIIPEETDPAELVQDAVNTARSLVEMRGLEMKLEIAPDLPHLWIDATRIRQVLFNLLNNAVRFTEAGTVSLKVCQRGDTVIFSVSDTGIGIAEADIPRLFREFEQLDGSTRRRYGGAGLGLAISKRFVELHGGHIWVESTLDKGSTFSFALPVEKRPVTTTLSPNAPIPATNEPILLLMTGSYPTASLLARHIQGYRTVIASSLAQVEQLVQQVKPQCILIDTANTQQTSETVQSFLEKWNLTETPIIALSLSGEDIPAQQPEVEGYLMKPVSIESIRDTLHQFNTDKDRVLVIDDDRDFVQMIRRILESPLRHYEVISAYSGQEALSLLAYHKPGLVFLDLELPDMTGIELLNSIRLLPDGANLPVIIMSGKDDAMQNILIREPILLARKQGFSMGKLMNLLKLLQN